MLAATGMGRIQLCHIGSQILRPRLMFAIFLYGDRRAVASDRLCKERLLSICIGGVEKLLLRGFRHPRTRKIAME